MIMDILIKRVFQINILSENKNYFLKIILNRILYPRNVRNTIFMFFLYQEDISIDPQVKLKSPQDLQAKLLHSSNQGAKPTYSWSPSKSKDILLLCEGHDTGAMS